MSRPKVFVTRAIPADAIAKLEEIAEVTVWDKETPLPYDVLRKMAAESDGILTMLTDKIDAALIENSPRLKVISQMAVGYDNIDLPTATRCRIPVGHTPGILTETTADLAWTLLMAAARRVVESYNEVREGIWRPWGPDVLTGQDIHGATLGIIGMGRIGKAVARRSKGFNMKVLYVDPTPQPDIEAEVHAQRVEFDTLLRESDFISLHAYLSPQTNRMINREQFELMKHTVVLVNTARGAMIDPDALTWALQTNRIAAAGLDVFDPEPIPPTHPILKQKNLVITAHIASASKQTRRHMAFVTVDNLIAGLNGERVPLCANPQVYQ